LQYLKGPTQIIIIIAVVVIIQHCSLYILLLLFMPAAVKVMRAKCVS